MLISVIIPCYNVEKYIAECIDSVLLQTHKAIEIICVDNNSTDKTSEILQAYQAKHADKILLLKEPQKGAPFARNAGLAIAKGEWIQFLDADDLLESSKISHQLQLIKSEKSEISFVAGACKKQSASGSQTIVLINEKNKFLAPFISQAGNTCSNLWYKNALRDVGNWNVELKSSQETDLMLRILLNGGSFMIDNEPYTIIREREEGQISQTNPIEKWERFFTIRNNHLSAIKEKFPAVYQQYKSDFLTSLLSAILILAKYDVKRADTLFELIKNELKFIIPNQSVSKKVLLLIRLVGFKSAIMLLKLTGR